jgi:DNA primase
MNAEIIARARGGRKVGSEWIAHCPVHDDRSPSLTIRDTKNGKVLVCCHAGCAQDDIIATLKSSGLWTVSGRRLIKIPYPITERLDGERAAGKRAEVALSIWQHALPLNGTLVETYLRSRGLRLPMTKALRFNATLRHTSGGWWPAMIGLVTRGDDATPLAIHRTFLDRNGTGKAPFKPQKMMLGPCRGGVVRLAEPDDVLLVGEGIETCLAAMQETGHAAWAALSTSGLRALQLPRNVRDVIVLADGDDPGEAAARDCAMRWKRERRRVRIAHPPKGMDFNDMLMSRVPFNEEGTQ